MSHKKLEKAYNISTLNICDSEHIKISGTSTAQIGSVFKLKIPILIKCAEITPYVTGNEFFGLQLQSRVFGFLLGSIFYNSPVVVKEYQADKNKRFYSTLFLCPPSEV